MLRGVFCLLLFPRWKPVSNQRGRPQKKEERMREKLEAALTKLLTHHQDEDTLILVVKRESGQNVRLIRHTIDGVPCVILATETGTHNRLFKLHVKLEEV